MTNEELEELLREWAAAKGGTVTYDDLEALAAVLGEHFPNPEETTFDEARQLLRLA